MRKVQNNLDLMMKKITPCILSVDVFKQIQLRMPGKGKRGTGLYIYTKKRKYIYT